jgi:hypothetical protein
LKRYKLPRACTIPGHGELRVNFWDLRVMAQSTWYVLKCLFHELLPDPTQQISQSIIFVFLLTFVSTLPDLPVGLYQTFVLEEQHGFNKTTLPLFFADILKGWALGIVIGTPALAAFLYIFEWAGDRFVPWTMTLL